MGTPACGRSQEPPKYDEAKPLYERAISINEAVFGPDHLEVAANVHNYAACLYNAEEYDKAKPLFERALEIRTAQLGDDHPDTLNTVDWLADWPEDEE